MKIEIEYKWDDSKGFEAMNLKALNRDNIIVKLSYGEITINNKETDEEYKFHGNVFDFIDGFLGGLRAIENGNIPNDIKGVGFWDGQGNYEFDITKNEGEYEIKESNNGFSIKGDYLEFESLLEKFSTRVKLKFIEAYPEIINIDYFS